MSNTVIPYITIEPNKKLWLRFLLNQRNVEMPFFTNASSAIKAVTTNVFTAILTDSFIDQGNDILEENIKTNDKNRFQALTYVIEKIKKSTPNQMTDVYVFGMINPENDPCLRNSIIKAGATSYFYANHLEPKDYLTILEEHLR